MKKTLVRTLRINLVVSYDEVAKRVEVDDYEDAIDATDLDIDDNDDISGGGDEVAEVPGPFKYPAMETQKIILFLPSKLPTEL